MFIFPQVFKVPHGEKGSGEKTKTTCPNYELESRDIIRLTLRNWTVILVKLVRGHSRTLPSSHAFLCAWASSCGGWVGGWAGRLQPVDLVTVCDNSSRKRKPRLFYCSHPSWCGRVSHCDCQSLFLMTNDVKDPVGHLCTPFGKMFISILCPLLN